MTILWVVYLNQSGDFCGTMCGTSLRPVCRRCRVMHPGHRTAVDTLSGTLLWSHAPALLSGIFIPILQRTNRLWLAAAARAAGLHTGIRAGHHEKCGANRNRTSCIQLYPEGSSGRVGYKFRRLHVMQVCYLKPLDARPSRDGNYGVLWQRRAVWGLTVRGWRDQNGSDSLGVLIIDQCSCVLSPLNGTLLQRWRWTIAVPPQQSACSINRHLSRLA